MKRIGFIIGITALFVGLSSFVVPKPSLVGKWKGTDEGQVGILTFDKKGYVTFTIDGQQIGGKEYTAEGIVFDMYYETDESVIPNTMDFVIKMHDDQVEVIRMLGIYQLVDKNTLQINMKFDGSERPTSMDPESEDHITLTRMK